MLSLVCCWRIKRERSKDGKDTVKDLVAFAPFVTMKDCVKIQHMFFVKSKISGTKETLGRVKRTEIHIFVPFV